MIYFLGHLAPVVVKVTEGGSGGMGRSGSSEVVRCLAAGPGVFHMGRGNHPGNPTHLWPFAGYVATVSLYSLIYTTIALFVGLLLFEDRDLA